jgi:hypothetical protein
MNPQPATVTAIPGIRSRFLAAFTCPELPPDSRRAFRFHMTFAVLDAVKDGILANTPLMAVKAMLATDAQLQIPLVISSVGFLASVFMGVAMATRHKKPFVVLPGFLSAIAMLMMAATTSAVWFLCASGLVSILEFAMRPAVPSILRIVYPNHSRSHVAGTLRQYASVVFLGSSLLFAFLLTVAGKHILTMIHAELIAAGVASLCAYLCFQRLPDRGDGSADEALQTDVHSGRPWREKYGQFSLTPLRDPRFRRFLTIFFIYACGNLFYMGIVPSYFAHDLGFGYFEATLFIHIIPAIAGFLLGGRLTAWFDRTSVWRSYGVVMLLWGADPTLLAIAPFLLPVVVLARIVRGPATVGSMVLSVYTGVHRFAKPGPETSCYMSALFLVNGVARLLAPSASALVVGHLSHRGVLLVGGLAVLTASALFFRMAKQDSHEASFPIEPETAVA